MSDRITRNDNALSVTEDISLVDDENEKQFRSTTLTLSSEQLTNDHSNRDADNDSIGPCHVATSPLTGSSSGVSSNDTTDSPHLVINEYFGHRNGAIENAAENCKPIILNHIDGSLRGVWLLTEIDHWDAEKERMVFLCDKSVIVIKYDFIVLRLLEYKRYLLSQFDSIIIGQLKYPEGSLIPNRNRIGVRCQWNRGREIPMIMKWNPWCKTVPFITFCSHPIITESPLWSHPSRGSYDVDDFGKSLAQTVQQMNSNGNCQIYYHPIMIENYIGIVTAVHNVTNLGFFKARGSFSF